MLTIWFHLYMQKKEARKSDRRSCDRSQDTDSIVRIDTGWRIAWGENFERRIGIERMRECREICRMVKLYYTADSMP